MTLALTLYRAISALLAGPLARRELARLERAGVDETRRLERLGTPTRPRPKGELVWVNAVSVGETISALGVIEALTQQGVGVLLTTTTATAAETAARRLPDGAMHQFAPLDTPGAVARFLDHWEPNLAVFVESDVWPRQLRAAKSRGLPVALINARLSKTSIRNWRLIRWSAKKVLRNFDRIYCQTAHTADALRPLLAPTTRLEVSGDLKASAAPLPTDQATLTRLRRAVGDRPVWAALSTHEGEEVTVAQAHLQVLRDNPQALLILAPRHPARGADLAEHLRAQGFRVAQRSKDQPLAPEVQIYLADTLGELGLWFALSPMAFIGASLIPKGGHNPYEALPFGTYVITGPHTRNFPQAYGLLTQAGAATRLADTHPESLRAALGDLRQSPAQSAAIAQLPLGDPDLPGIIASELLDLMHQSESPHV